MFIKRNYYKPNKNKWRKETSLVSILQKRSAWLEILTFHMALNTDHWHWATSREKSTSGSEFVNFAAWRIVCSHYLKFRDFSLRLIPLKAREHSPHCYLTQWWERNVCWLHWENTLPWPLTSVQETFQWYPGIITLVTSIAMDPLLPHWAR